MDGRPEAAHDNFVDPARRLILNAIQGRLGETADLSVRGEAFALALYLRAQCEALNEQRWRMKAEGPRAFADFVSSLWSKDLLALEFLKPQMPASGDYHSLIAATQTLVVGIPESEFASSAIRTVSALLGDQTYSQFKMDRAFDDFDFVFGLRFDDDEVLKTDLGLRLYEGGGAGVQTSYASILTLLKHLAPKKGARFVDLGCGFGRLGLAGGMWREDLNFTGYEFVPHRAAGASRAAERMGLQSHVDFHSQDLGDAAFKIPEADFYYLYDPFTDEVYRHVMARLMEVSNSREVTVITKGDAGRRFQEATRGWRPAEKIDADGLLIFRSA